jgi:hypothetical protein
MQAAVPELTDVSDEPPHILAMYGPDVEKPGSYAHNCLLARRLIERDVRFVQLYHMGWDQHLNLPVNITQQCRDTDQPSAALLADLAQRGLLEDTLVVWGGELAAPSTRRASSPPVTTAATTTLAASASGWPAPA